jgi:hypothetical protein
LGSHTLGIAFCARLLRTVEVGVVLDGVSSRIKNCFIEVANVALCRSQSSETCRIAQILLNDVRRSFQRQRRDGLLFDN